MGKIHFNTLEKKGKMFPVAYYEPDLNDRIRVVLQYDRVVRPILWFQVRRDGSIYFGLRRKNVLLKKGSKMAKDTSGGKVRIDYSDGKIIYNPDSRKNPRISYQNCFYVTSSRSTLKVKGHLT